MTTMLPSSRLARTGSLEPLNEEIIPATKGKFYVYQSKFTSAKPLFALLDCKANKFRDLVDVNMLGHEVHLHFEFENVNYARVSSIKTAAATGLLGNINTEFDDVYVASTSFAIKDFYTLCARRDSAKLIKLCKSVCSQYETSTDITRGTVIAIMTGTKKYGLFLVNELSTKFASIDAYHIVSR